jgi:hypothetical protein
VYSCIIVQKRGSKIWNTNYKALLFFRARDCSAVQRRLRAAAGAMCSAQVMKEEAYASGGVEDTKAIYSGR